jgi:aryl-alcohol dehydrogenase-like predicted oxidoreductase
VYVSPDNTTNIFSPSSGPAKLLKGSERFGVDYVDGCFVHRSIHPSSISQAAKGLTECADAGMAKTIVVANYSKEDMLKMRDALAQSGVPLALNQGKFSILRRIPETSSLLQTCRENGIVFQSYSSLAQGRLSGKYTKYNPPPKTYRFSSYPMEEIEPTLQAVRDIAHKRGVPMSAVALNYNLSKGVQPVVGIRKPVQVEQNVQALAWRLTNEEMQRLDDVSIEGKTTKL